MRKPGLQLHARRDWPWVRGHGDGIAIETLHGTFRTMEFWHHEVNQWVARLLSEASGAKLIDDEADRQSAAAQPRPGGMPQKVARKDLAILGVGLIFLGSLFGWLFSGDVVDSWDARHWRSTAGIVDAVERNPPGRGKDRHRIRYHYTAGEETYVNDRFRLSQGYSLRAERKKASLAVGDTVRVWYDPDDPQRSTLDRNFALFELLACLVSAGAAIGGIAVLVYSAAGRNSPLAEHYAKDRRSLP